MDRAALHLYAALDRLADVDSEDMLRGVEGAAAAAYFTAFDRMIRPPVVFESRSKHPAHNATNALLNLGYVLLGNEIASCLDAAGFDPRIGYFHGLRERVALRDLACQLVPAYLRRGQIVVQVSVP